MPNALFVGNGLNRCYPTLHSWGGMLESLAERLGVSGNKNASFTMEFERIANIALKKGRFSGDQAFRRIKTCVVSSMLNPKSQPQVLHRCLMELPVKEILTTNYDYMLEYAWDPGFFQRGIRAGSDEIRYSLYRKQIVGGKIVRHIHGEAKAPSSVCLGFEHYAGALAKLRGMLLAHEPGVRDVVLFNLLRGERKSTGSFADLFFTHDLFFVGYGLDRVKVDVWWLLTYRAFLMNANYRGMASFIKNRIVFYHVGEERESFLQLHSLLESLNVEVVFQQVPAGSYERGYLNVLEKIRQHLRGNESFVK